MCSLDYKASLKLNAFLIHFILELKHKMITLRTNGRLYQENIQNRYHAFHLCNPKIIFTENNFEYVYLQTNTTVNKISNFTLFYDFTLEYKSDIARSRSVYLTQNISHLNTKVTFHAQ